MPYYGPSSKSRIAVVICYDRRPRVPSFGENLRREREQRNITLEQISQSTKIGTRMLQALEADKFSQLPGGIFNKGFVRAYARHVGLDEEQAIADYLQASGETTPVMPEMPPEQPAPRIVADPEPETPRRPLPWGLFAALLLLAALALSLWSHRQKNESPAPPSPQPTPTHPSAEGNAPKSTPPVNPAPSSPPTAKALSAAPSPQPVKPTIAETPVTAAAKITTISPSTAGFVINIQAREDSWTLITSDGKPVFSGMLEAGDQRSIRGQKEVVVRAGNSGAVDLYFNGKKIPPTGDYGEIRTTTFGPEGVTPNSPSPPPNR
jgi:cytoskeleton protein RodZ